MADLQCIRRRVEVQGFLGLTDADLGGVAPWMRFTPTMNFLAIALATGLASPLLLGALAVVMAVGAAGRAHPFDLLHNLVVRRFTRSPALPPSADRRRFIFGIAAAWLAGTAYAFYSGAATAGYLLGGTMATLIVPLAAAHICVVSEALERLFGPVKTR